MSQATLRLDGGTATELRRGGIPMSSPWWMTRAVLSDARRRVLRDVHERFLGAGAQVITANTFRCNLRSLTRAGLEDAGLAWMVHASIGVAFASRNAAGTPETLIAASIAPVEDCYRPDVVPPDEELRVEHKWLATELSRSNGVDIALIETMNCEREARIALAAAQEAGLRGWVSFICDDGGKLLSGEPLDRVAKALEADGAEAVLVNCSPVEQTEEALRVLRDACSGPIGAYPNIEDRSGLPPWTHYDGELPVGLTPDEFGELIARWQQDYNLTMVGGCCGTTPDHIAAMSARLKD